MPTNTYVSLGTITLASNEADILLSSIPAGYRDLILVLGGKRTGTGGALGLEIYFNNDQTAGNYSHVYAVAYSGGAISGSGTNIPAGIGVVQDTLIWQIMDYATDKHKTILNRNNTSGTEVGMVAGRWANTSAITSILLKDSAAGFSLAAGTTISLYGVN